MSSTPDDSAHPAADPWEPSSSTYADALRRVRRAGSQKAAVPDSWDEEEEEDVDVDNAMVWQNANAKQPMPTIVAASSSTFTTSALPPAAAFQAPLRILKRPTPSSTASPTPESATAAAESALRSLRAREAQYHAARARIFGAGTPAESSDVDAAKNVTPSGLVSSASAEGLVSTTHNDQGPAAPVSRGASTHERSPPPPPSSGVGPGGTTPSASAPASASVTVSVLRSPRGPSQPQTQAKGTGACADGESVPQGFGNGNGRRRGGKRGQARGSSTSSKEIAASSLRSSVGGAGAGGGGGEGAHGFDA